MPLSEVSVTIRFPSEAAARAWMAWHDNQGEQDYWQYADDQRGISFSYDYPKLMVTATEQEDE